MFIPIALQVLGFVALFVRHPHICLDMLRGDSLERASPKTELLRYILYLITPNSRPTLAKAAIALSSCSLL